MYNFLTVTAETSKVQTSEATSNAIPIATIITILFFIGICILGLFILRAVYRFIKKPPKEKRSKNCDFCENNYILCKHYGNETPVTAEYCPICGRKLRTISI